MRDSHTCNQVLASYIQQLAIAILGWLFFRGREIYLPIWRRFLPRTKTRLPKKLAASKPRPITAATIFALVGFQETQIFFSITLQVVCLITFRKSSLLMAPSVTELAANRFLVKVVAATGVYPVVLNLCTIHRSQKTVDWFILIASSCCVSLAIVTWSFANSLAFEPQQLDMSDPGPKECGHVNRMRYCFGDLASDNIFANWLERWSLTPYNSVFLSEPMIVVPLLVLIGLAVTKFEVFPTKDADQGDISWAVSQLTRDGQGYIQQRHLKAVLHFLIAIVEHWLLISSIVLLVAVSLLMVPVVARQDSWSLGQIIAIAVWVPVLVNWLHLLYRKLLSIRPGYVKLIDSIQEARKRV